MLESSVNLVRRSLLYLLPLFPCYHSRCCKTFHPFLRHRDSNPWYHENSSLAGLELISQRKYKSVSSSLLKQFAQSRSFYMKTIQTMNSIPRTSLYLNSEVLLVGLFSPFIFLLSKSFQVFMLPMICIFSFLCLRNLLFFS